MTFHHIPLGFGLYLNIGRLGKFVTVILCRYNRPREAMFRFTVERLGR